MLLQDKKILLIIAGGIAAYKSLDLIRRLRERGAKVRVIMTRAAQEFVTPLAVGAVAGERPFTESVRYRTVGDMSCTGAVASTALALEDVVAEIAATKITERGETRADDKVSEAAMEDRKVAGYF
jgi:sulfate adenylyltransferase subunit 2